MINKVFDYQLPFHPEGVWNTLPYAVQRTKNASSIGQAVTGGYRYAFSTGMTLVTFGFTVFVDLYPTEQGTHMRVNAKMNFGLVDWGEGRRIADDLNRHLMALLSWQADQGYGYYQQ